MTTTKIPMRILAVLVVALIGSVATVSMFVKATKAPTIDAYFYFTDASPLIKGNDVKAGGVKVGTIASIEVDHGQAKVGLALDDAVMPLHRDASARVRPVGLLGERYVELKRGSTSSPVLGVGQAIPNTQTTRATDLDEVLSMVDQPTGVALSALVTTLGEGLRGHGKDVDAALKALAPALRDTDRLARILDDQNGVLLHLLDTVQPVAREIATDRGRQLDGLVEAAVQTLAATTDRDPELDETLSRLPGTLGQTRRTLQALTAAAGATTPTLRALRPTTDQLPEISRELRAFTKAGTPALEALDPVLARTRELLTKARPVVASLGKLGPDLRSTAHSGSRLASELIGNLRNVLDFVKFWALTTNGQDGLSHYFRAHLVITPESLTGLIPGQTSAPEGAKGPGSASSGGLTGTVNGLVDDVLGGLGLPDLGLGGDSGGSSEGLLGGLLGGNRTTAQRTSPSSVTGLSATQEDSLMTYLIGGE